MAYVPKQMKHEFGLCIDWETSGADFGKDSSINYQGLTFGAIVFKTDTFEPVEELYVEIKFDSTKYKWSDVAEKIHGKTREYLEEHGVTQQEAAMDLAELILKYWGPSSKILFLGHNPEFDRRFTNQLLNTIEIEFSVERTDPPKFDSWIEVFHVVLDTSALGYITLGLYKSDLLFERIGFEKRKEHNALDDARFALQTCAAIRALVDGVING